MQIYIYIILFYILKSAAMYYGPKQNYINAIYRSYMYIICAFVYKPCAHCFGLNEHMLCACRFMSITAHFAKNINRMSGSTHARAQVPAKLCMFVCVVCVCIWSTTLKAKKKIYTQQKKTKNAHSNAYTKNKQAPCGVGGVGVGRRA